MAEPIDTELIPPITVEDFTTALQANSDVDGTGVFDIMMNSVRANVYEEFEEGRITGVEYSTVYLAAMNSAGDRALQFLLNKDKVALEANNLKYQGELLLLQAEKLELEKQLVAAQLLQIENNIKWEDLKGPGEVLILESTNLKIKSETNLLDENLIKVETEIKWADLKGPEEVNVLEGTVCKLAAEYDVLMQQKLKVIAEAELAGQKTATEAAQTSGLNVEGDSVIGRQKELYKAQGEAFIRDGEQKATKIMVDTWNVRKTTDEETTTEQTNLDNASIGKAVTKLMQGIGVT